MSDVIYSYEELKKHEGHECIIEEFSERSIGEEETSIVISSGIAIKCLLCNDFILQVYADEEIVMRQKEKE